MEPHTRAASKDRVKKKTEWPTFGLTLVCYAGWLASIFALYPVAPTPAVIVTGLLVALHASLTHEVLHGHPFRAKWLNELLILPTLNLVIPYNRFRDLHLAHHRDAKLTDPYDDPETNYLDPAVWRAMPGWKRQVFAMNNTLMGRMVLGPLIGQILFMRSDWRAARRGDRAVILAWALHGIGAGMVLWAVLLSPMPVWAYLISVYIGLAILKIRTFLEHQAHAKVRARTVIIEDRGPLAFMFLNNNLHVVHHMNPNVAWYRLPALYAANRDKYLTSNDGYVFRSYGEVFRRYLWRPKDPVPHPLWPQQ